MPSLVIYNTSVIEMSPYHATHATIGDPQVISCTSIADATTKLQTALGSTAGAGNAATHAANFSARQNGYSTPSTHVMSFGSGLGATATYKP